jgi:hypothetical protein
MEIGEECGIEPSDTISHARNMACAAAARWPKSDLLIKPHFT